MKEKIEALSQGKFEYEPPLLCPSKEEIRIEAIAGQTYEDSFTIKNSIGRKMKGVIYSSNRLLTLPDDKFVGTEATVTYSFNATFLEPGDMVEGEITIVSDCGEYMIPFLVKVEAPYFTTSIGKVKDLFQFTNLAREDWSEARKIFRSENFKKVFLSDNKTYFTIYKNLLKSISTSQALEEFLIVINKKKIIRLTIDKTKVEYNVINNEVKDKLVLTKNHWGYSEIRVSTDAPFIKLEQKRIWTDGFMGNSHHLLYTINPQHMRNGSNFGRIYIKTVNQNITVDVYCNKKTKEDEYEQILLRRRAKNINYEMMRNYLDFRLDNINLSTYKSNITTLLNNMVEDEESIIIDLIKIHLAILSDKNDQAEKMLYEIADKEIEVRKRSIFEYCAYLYLLALHRKKEDIIDYAANTIKRYYRSGNFDWRLLWFLLYTDRRYDNRKNLKLDNIKEQFYDGCSSPILYYEAMLVYNEEPYLLNDFTEFEIQVMNYGIKNHMLTKDCIDQYTYLADRMKKFHPVVFRGLDMLYQESKSDQVLSSICSMLIKGLKRESKYFKWFKLAVEAQLRITGLYEYYIYSIDENTNTPIDEPVLLYFIYNSNINNSKKAFLYSYIVKNKETNEEIYNLYYKKMQLFALKQLEAHVINSKLAVLYEEFFNHKDMIDANLAKYLPHIYFTYELFCQNPNMISVTVYHREIGEEKTTTLDEGRAIITRYTESAEVFFTDSYGYKYSVSVNYYMRPLLNTEKCVEEIVSYNEHPIMLLHLYDRYERNHILSEGSIAIREKVLALRDLKENYRAECIMSLVDYYFENYEDDNLDNYLGDLEIEQVRVDERIRFLEYLVVRGFYEKAMEILKNFRFEDISVNRLIRLCSGLLVGAETDIKQDNLLSLCHYIFTKGKYDEETIQYLVRYYYGPTRDIFSVWKAAKGFDKDTPELEERFLSGMLFAESNLTDSYKVFVSYYEDSNNRMLVRAYLTYYAYKYLVHNHVINDGLFEIMKRELNYESNDFYLLAWLKYNSQNKKFSEDEINFIDMSINNLEKRGIVLPFFLEYNKHINLPGRLLDKTYVEYKANPKSKVYIHYRLLNNESDEYITEAMPNVFQGIHVKGFTLFYHEVFQYYITEEKDGDQIVTESFHLQYNKEMPVEVVSRYNKINLMLIAIQMQDDASLLETMEEYVLSEYIISKCFYPVQ